jgi:hypothetical protein
MITSVKFFSKEEVESMSGSATVGMISITNPVGSGPNRSPGTPAKLDKEKWGALIRLEFDDVTPSISYRYPNYQLMTEEQAREILDWLEEHEDDLKAIYVHCEAGISRSAAVAKFLGEIYNRPFQFLDVKYANDHVFKLLSGEWVLRKERTRYRDEKGTLFELMGRGYDYRGAPIVVLRVIRGLYKPGTYITALSTVFYRQSASLPDWASYTEVTE